MTLAAADPETWLEHRQIDSAGWETADGATGSTVASRGPTERTALSFMVRMLKVSSALTLSW